MSDAHGAQWQRLQVASGACPSLHVMLLRAGRETAWTEGSVEGESSRGRGWGLQPPLHPEHPSCRCLTGPGEDARGWCV